MKRFFKWLAILLGSLVGLILVAGVVMFLVGNARLNRVYDFPPSNITIPTDEPASPMANIASKHCVPIVTLQTWAAFPVGSMWVRWERSIPPT